MNPTESRSITAATAAGAADQFRDQVRDQAVSAYRRRVPGITETEADAMLELQVTHPFLDLDKLQVAVYAYRAGVERGRGLELMNQRARLDALAENPDDDR